MRWQATGGPGGQQWVVGQARSGARPQARGPLRDSATGISARRSVSALLDDPIQAGRRTEAGEGTDVASAYQHGCDQDIAGAWDVSADGSGIMTPRERLGEGFPGSSSPPAGRPVSPFPDSLRLLLNRSDPEGTKCSRSMTVLPLRSPPTGS